jgi:tetratricopeptide (TPR) repeat protein
MPLAASGQDRLGDDDVAGPLDQTVPVAEGAIEIETPVADQEEQAATEEDLLREFGRFRQLLEEKNFDAADIAAKRVVQMSIEIFGPQSAETAKALNNLAIVQHNNKQYEAAIQNFTSAIEIIEAVEDRLNAGLVNPLKGLGAAQLSNGRPDLASNSFIRARHITHVNEGPHNIEQVEILESLAEANVRLGDIEAARDVLDRIHALNVRHFEDDRLGLLPSLMRRADWQHRAGYYNDERATYRRAVRIVEESAGKKDERLVDPLLRLGKSFYYYEPITDSLQRPVGNSPESYLKRAVRIAEETPDYPWLGLAEARLALADYYVVTESHNRARKIYKEVWDELSADESRLEMRNELMGNPEPVWQEPLPDRTKGASSGPQNSSKLLTGVININYTISDRGRVQVMRTEANPPEFTDMQRLVHREVRRRAFRPAIVDGVPVEASGQIFRHEFLYLESEREEIREQNAANAQDSTSKS